MLELLNNIDHRDLRVLTRRGAAWGDDVMSCPLTPDEFRQAQAHYPIVFQADGAGGKQRGGKDNGGNGKYMFHKRPHSWLKADYEVQYISLSGP